MAAGGVDAGAGDVVPEVKAAQPREAENAMEAGVKQEAHLQPVAEQSSLHCSPRVRERGALGWLVTGADGNAAQPGRQAW